MRRQAVLYLITGALSMVILMAGLSLEVLNPASAQSGTATPSAGRNTLHIRAGILDGGAYGDGSSCHPFGVTGVNLDIEVLPWRQLIITDDTGRIVGILDLYEGIGDRFDRCVFESDMMVPDSPFYTITV